MLIKYPKLTAVKKHIQNKYLKVMIRALGPKLLYLSVCMDDCRPPQPAAHRPPPGQPAGPPALYIYIYIYIKPYIYIHMDGLL
jgi:hypothetical protein